MHYEMHFLCNLLDIRTGDNAVYVLRSQRFIIQNTPANCYKTSM